jgi:hypothetical protein
MFLVHDAVPQLGQQVGLHKILWRVHIAVFDARSEHVRDSVTHCVLASRREALPTCAGWQLHGRRGHALRPKRFWGLRPP